MSYQAFDPWAALARIRAEAKAQPGPPRREGAPEVGLGELAALGGGHPAKSISTPPAEHWLVSIGRAIAAAIAAGAEREADEGGFIVLIRPDGDRLAVAPHIVAELDAAGLLPVLPEPVGQSTFAARARPPEWWDGTDTPQAGDRCRCGSRRFWTERARPGGWRCSTCHPALHLVADEVLVVTTDERTEP